MANIGQWRREPLRGVCSADRPTRMVPLAHSLLTLSGS
jgi:hypothetical protein